MATIGTAGHVDHGKSTLVRALTGMDPDRLAEEKARGMTIDLGFAWLTLPDGRAVSIVDVPGHEDFIKNMLAGVGGIDLALLVVAADEGVMPQTVEHLAILDLLRVPQGIVALTKADLVDADWLELAREDVATALAPTCLAGAPIIPVAATTGLGLAELVREIGERTRPHRRLLLQTLPATDAVASYAPRQRAVPHPLPILKDGEGSMTGGAPPPRLPIDRVFSVAGFGTVVTGTLLDGALRVGDEVEVMPGGIRARARGLQQHNAAAAVAEPGTRVALNLAGIDRAELARGMVVSLPGALAPTTRLDARLICARSAPREIRQNMRVEVFVGAAVVPARVKLLAGEALAPGEAGWAQVILDRPIVALRGDRFVVRNPSPSETLGGGEILDPQPRPHRRRQPEVVTRLAALASDDSAVVVGAILRGERGSAVFYTEAEIARAARRPLGEIQTALAGLRDQGAAVMVGAWFSARERWERLCAASHAALADYHQRHPLRLGMPRETWRALIDLPAQIDAITDTLQAEKRIVVATSRNRVRPAVCVALPDHAPRLAPAQEQQLRALRAALGADPLNPPGMAEIARLAAPEVVEWALDQGEAIRVSPDILLLATAWDDARSALVAYLRERERVTVAEARDLLGGTRRVIVPLLELCDALRITRRVGDTRLLGLRA